MPLLSIDGGSNYVSPQPTLPPDAPSSATIPPLEIRLLGGFTALVRGVPLRKLRTRQGNRLLALLALAEGKEQERAALLTQLWPDALTEAKAQSSLRRTLTDLRDALGPESDRLLSPTKFTLALDLSRGATVDTREFDREIARRTDADRDRAIERYAGPLMPDLDSFNDNDGRISRERERRQFHYLTAVEERADQRRMRGETSAAIADLRRLLAVEPTRETASRALMELLSTGMDDRDGAMAEYQRLRRRLASGDGATPERETEAIFERIKAESIDQLSASPLDVPNNLPHALTRFIGREKEIGELRRLLRENRLLTLTGTGGAGKTRLAERIAADAATAYPDGVYLVELAPIVDADLVARATLTVLGFKDRPGQSVLSTLIDGLKSRNLLLLLDNCEHLLPACASLIAALLRACPSLRILTTSREPIGVFGEQTYRVPSLTIPADLQEAESATIDTVGQYEAVHLFLDRAALYRPDFTLTEANASALAKLCYLLDGIPLALELAAARLRHLPLDALLAQLDDRFRLLTTGDRAALPRQRTLRALVDWSFELLTPEEKTLFARLSVFAGGWTRNAAEFVGADAASRGDTVPSGSAIDSAEVSALLESLADKSLIQAEEQQNASLRYRMLETLRQYAAERLADSGEIARTRRRHQDWCIALASEAQPKLSGPDQAIWLNRLEIEHDNLRAALTADGCGEEETDASPLRIDPCLRLSGSLWYFWYIRGYFTEGRERLTRAIDNARRQNALQSGDGARALNGRGNLATAQSDYAVARESYAEALGYYRERGDRQSAGQVLSNLGSLAQYEGDLALAYQLYTEGSVIFRELGNREDLAYSLSSLGGSALMSGDLPAARSLLEESLAILREFGDPSGIAMAVMNLGGVARAQGDLSAARALREEGLALFRESGNQEGIAAAQLNLGIVVQKQGDITAARSLYLEALALCRKIGERRKVAHLLECLGSVSLAGDDALRFVTLAAAADVMREQLGLPPADPSEREGWPEYLARAHAALGEPGFAIAWDQGRAMTGEQAVAFALNE